MDINEAPSKSHRRHHTGRKANKKILKSDQDEASAKQKNPRAFAFQSANKLNRAFRQ